MKVETVLAEFPMLCYSKSKVAYVQRINPEGSAAR